MSLYKLPTNKNIVEDIKTKFNHPGILLFRSRELFALRDYMSENPQTIDKKVLDLGCGEGDLGDLLFNKIDVGLDPLKSETDKAIKRKAYKSVKVGDARNLPFEEGSFDIVFSNSTIEHIKGLDSVLNNVKNVLKNDGLFIFTAPSATFSKYLFFTQIFHRLYLSFLGDLYAKLRNAQLSHYNLYDVEDWNELLREHDLEVTYHRYYLSAKEMYEWDKVSLFLKFISFIKSLFRKYSHRYNLKFEELLLSSPHQVINKGGSVLIVARKVK